jgi:predicted DNA-binding protein YlxM (UPF0122 family)
MYCVIRYPSEQEVQVFSAMKICTNRQQHLAPGGLPMKLSRQFIPVFLLVFSSAWSLPALAKEYQVDCSSVDDCMARGDQLTRKRKLSLALEAYRNAIKLDVENTDAWRKFENMVVRIYEEGGC